MSCERYTTLMYVDMCRTCYEAENALERADAISGALMEAGFERFRAWLVEYRETNAGAYRADPKEIIEKAWMAAWMEAPNTAARIEHEYDTHQR